MTAARQVPATIILFDFDGTLVDSTPAVKVSLQQAAAALASPLPDPAILDAAIAKGVLMGDLIRLIQPEADAATVDRWLQAYAAAYDRIGLQHSTLFPGAAELLLHLQRQNYRMAIVSNKAEPAIHVALQHFGLENCFQQVWGEQTDLPGKPSPELFLRKIRAAYPQAERRDFIMIGDTVADRDFAAASQIRFVLVEYGYGEVSLQGHAGSCRIHALAELLPLLPPGGPAG